jgi:hypothetical protein
MDGRHEDYSEGNARHFIRGEVGIKSEIVP